MSNPRVYVGTYGKYNRGSLAGGWISLRECKSHEDFLRKCRALHRGERDPEYMIQDTEDFPDGLSCMEWLSEQDFNDVMQACREEDAEEQADATEPLSLEDRLREALRRQLGGQMTPPTPKAKATGDDKALLEDFMHEMEKGWHGDKHMLDYERKQFSGAVRLQNGGILYFTKPTIDNKFCFHDEGPDYEFYQHLIADRETRLAEYFVEQNIGEMNREIAALESNCRKADGDYLDGYYGKAWYLERVSYSGETEPMNLWRHKAIPKWDVKDHPDWYHELTPMGDQDRQTVLEGLRRERDKFDKRLRTYLKRYGTSKIHTWTYWADA